MSAPAFPRAALRAPPPPVVGHRGAMAHAPENTLAGIRRAHALGATWVEVDVALTQDGETVLLHDRTLDRTTNATGPVARHSAAELDRVDAGGRFAPAFAGEPVPRLSALAALAMTLSIGVNLEIKPTPGREAETGTRVARDAVRLWPDDAPLLLSSFSTTSLCAAAIAAPHLPRGLLADPVPETWITLARGLGCATFHCRHDRADEALIAAARAEGWPVLVYTVNEAERAKALLALGVAAVITDAPDRILAALA